MKETFKCSKNLIGRKNTSEQVVKAL